VDVDLDRIRRSLIKTALANYGKPPSEADIAFLAEETRRDGEFVREVIG
jgi:hypothetical protein